GRRRQISIPGPIHPSVPLASLADLQIPCRGCDPAFLHPWSGNSSSASAYFQPCVSRGWQSNWTLRLMSKTVLRPDTAPSRVPPAFCSSGRDRWNLSNTKSSPGVPCAHFAPTGPHSQVAFGCPRVTLWCVGCVEG